MRSARPPNSGPKSSLLFMWVMAKEAYAACVNVTNAKPRDCCELLSRITCGVAPASARCLMQPGSARLPQGHTPSLLQDCMTRPANRSAFSHCTVPLRDAACSKWQAEA